MNGYNNQNYGNIYSNYQPPRVQYSNQRPQMPSYQLPGYKQRYQPPQQMQVGNSVSSSNQLQVEGISAQSSTTQVAIKQKKGLTMNEFTLVKNMRILEILIKKRAAEITDKYDEDIQKIAEINCKQLKYLQISFDEFKQFLEGRDEYKRVKQAYAELRKIPDPDILIERIIIQQQKILNTEVQPTNGGILASIQNIFNKLKDIQDKAGGPDEDWRGYSILEAQLSAFSQKEQFIQEMGKDINFLQEDLEVILEDMQERKWPKDDNN